MALLSQRGGRAKFRARLAHMSDLDPRLAQSVAETEAGPEALERLLKAQGAPSVCSCVAGRLAYFEGEAPHDR